MASSLSLAVLIFVLTGVSCLQFSGNQPNIIHKCAGSDITLPWTFQQTSQDTITFMQWFFHGRSQEIIAMLSDDAFVPLPAFSDRVEHGSDGTLTIGHLTTEDSGNYTIEINGQDASGLAFTLSDTIYVEVAENLMTSDRQLHVTQSPRAVYNDVTKEWSLQLSCGRFTYVGQPPFAVEWVSPPGGRYNSSSYGDGQYHWLVPNPVEEGSYTCLIPSRYVHVLCLPPGTSQGLEATLAVDDLKVRMMLIEAQQRSLQQENVQLKADNQQLKADNQRLTQNISSLQQHVMQLETNSQQVTAFIQDTTRRHVSFHARMSSTHQHLQSGHTLILPTIYSNYGNAYSSSTGVFTAPYNATYFFIASTASASDSDDTSMELVVDGSSVGQTVAHRVYTDIEMGTCHAVVQLTPGQRVWLQSILEGYFNPGFTYFSGFLINT